MNRWEKAINEIEDRHLKKAADDAKALRTRYAFRFQVAQITQTPGSDEDGKIGALLEILELFAKREFGERMKKKAAEKAAKKESKDGQE